MEYNKKDREQNIFMPESLRQIKIYALKFFSGSLFYGIGVSMDLELTDYQLVQKCLDGEQIFFEELVERYKKLVYSVVWNKIKDKQEVNDIAQEIFIRLYKTLHKYNPEYKFSTWTVKIATNICLDILRKKKVDSVPIEEIEIMSKDDTTPEAQYLKEESRQQLFSAIDELPDKYKEPIIMFHQKGLSYEEIMLELNQPMSIVKNRLYRARIMLRQKLRHYVSHS